MKFPPDRNKTKINIKLSLYLIHNRAMKTYGGVAVLLHAFYTVEQFGGYWSATCPGRDIAVGIVTGKGLDD
jgi:hypothetical protein